MPVMYFTQMIGLAMGIGAKELGIGQEIVDARKALSKIGVEVPEEPKKKADKDALPMPELLQE